MTMWVLYTLSSSKYRLDFYFSRENFFYNVLSKISTQLHEFIMREVLSY